MNCPFCSTPLRVVNRQGIDVDWCPDCKGIWLERGELEKLIERNDRDDRDVRDDRYQRDDRDRDRYERDHDRDREPHYAGKRKKKSFLSEIFEFGD